MSLLQAGRGRRRRELVRDEFVDLAIRIKCADTSSQRQHIYDTVEIAIQSRCRGLIVDIDGTLTESGSVDPDRHVIERLLRVRDLGVPVALVTGRGRHAAREFIEHVRQDGRDFQCALSSVVVYCHQGGYYTRVGGTDAEPGWIPLRTPHPSEVREQWETALSSGIDASLEPFAVRLSINDRFHGMRDLDLAARRRGLRKTVGTFGGKVVVEYASVSKANAVEHFAHSIGTSESELYRVGDQGCDGGVDFGMLSHPCGFTVENCSPSPSGCLPIPGVNGEQLRNAAATTRLLELMCAGYVSTFVAPLRLS